MALFNLALYHNSLQTWLTALGVAIGCFLIGSLLRGVVAGRLRTRAERSDTSRYRLLAEVLGRTGLWFFLVLGLWAGGQVPDLPTRADTLLHSLLVLGLLLQIALWGSALITAWLGRRREQAVLQDAALATTLSALGFAGHVVLWSGLSLMALQNLGFHIDTLIAGLGISGIAVALAVQNILGDLFASLSILLDKPFLIGDFITVDAVAGTVEQIGLKTTRLRSLTGEQVIFANGDLLKSRVHNYRRMQERRVVFSLGVTYETPVTQLEQIPGLVREIIEGQQQVRFERAHLKDFGPYALNFEVVYWLLTPDYSRFMDTQQRINLELLRRFDADGIALAYPTQTLVLQPSESQFRVDFPLNKGSANNGVEGIRDNP